MTTATEPPLIDEPSIGVDELPALDQPDERVCELVQVDTSRRCHRVASWLLACDAADCGHWHGPVLVCAICHTAILSTLALVMCPTVDCPLACYIRWMEPL